MSSNETRNQHFVSQGEQKVNASNPNSSGGNFRIYPFRIADREAYRLVLEAPRGGAIASTLSMLDLFSFDVPGGGRLRMNLEALFHKYEANVEIRTKGLLEKLATGSADIKTELIDLFTAKLLNFVRNPFCLQKVLNSFPGIGQYEPTDPQLLATYRRIVEGQKPHQTYLCRQLDVSQETYAEWLRLIFVLLMETGDDRPNLFEGVIKGIDYIFADAATLVEVRAAPAFVATALANWRQRPQATINVTVTKNNRSMLARYNRRVFEQARKRVYCAEKAGFVLK